MGENRLGTCSSRGVPVTIFSKPFGCGIGDRNQDERERPRPSRQKATQEEFLTLSARLKQKRQNGSARPLTPQTMQRLYHTPLPITWIAAPDHEKRACVPRTHARARVARLSLIPHCPFHIKTLLCPLYVHTYATHPHQSNPSALSR